ncbi:hypothetical protein LWI28_017877 [Acer negundo]|uniref:START domain-containing protein n=1 Tax=Acer negundo TaxID=4023 RepID=A0AAD5NXN8_ACENE|nr:hypothetical protein LWI28_017877 [Acer negundo]
MEGVNEIICYYCDELILGDMNAFMEYNCINHFGIPGSSEASAINHPDFGTPSSSEPSAPEAAAEPPAPVTEPSAAATLAASVYVASTQAIIAFSVILLAVTLLAISVITFFALLVAVVAVTAQMLDARASAALTAAQAAQAFAAAFIVRGRIWNLGLLGNQEIVRQLLDADNASSSLIYKATDSNGQTHFHLVAENGQYSFFIMLVSYPDAIVALDGKQRNILHIAALNGNVVIVKLILTRFVIEDLINSPDEEGNNPLHLAAKNFYEDVVIVLSKNKKVDIRVTNHDQRVVLAIVELSTDLGWDIQKFLTKKILKKAITARAFYPEDILQDDTCFHAMERDFRQIRHAKNREMASDSNTDNNIHNHNNFHSSKSFVEGIPSLGDENAIGLETEAGSDYTQKITSNHDGDLEIELSSELRAVKNFIEGVHELGDENALRLEPEVQSDHTQGITDHNGDLEISLNGELRAVENFFEGVPSLGDENGMEVNNSQLGLEPEVNFEDSNNVMQYEEDIVSSSVSTVHESSPDLLESRASPTNVRNTTSPPMHRASDLLMAVSVSADTNKTKIKDLASAAMEELTIMASMGEPLWLRKGGDNIQPENLNSFEYMRQFGSVDATLEEIIRMVEVRDPNLPSLDPNSHELPVPGDNYRPPTMPRELKEQQSLEASRHLGFVHMTSVSIVELFMDVNQWLATFSNIVSRATLLGVISTGVEGSYDGALQVVTWVDHATVNGTVIHSIYRHLVVSGFAFGAQRWVASLIRHCQWLVTLRAAGTSANQVNAIIPRRGRKNMLKLSERMRRILWGDFGASSGNTWMSLPIIGAEDIRVMTKGNIHFPGKPAATMLAFTTSLRLPVPPTTVFNFLRDDISRIKWDVRLSRNLIQELAYINNGGLTENRVSILQVNATPLDIEMMYLQESFIDHTDAYVIYAPVDVPTMSDILNGRNIDNVNILPCGFAILPADDDRPVVFGSGGSRDGVCDSLLTMAFNIVDDQVSMEEYISPESLNMIYKIINRTAFLIRNALVPNNLQDNLDGV